MRTYFFFFLHLRKWLKNLPINLRGLYFLLWHFLKEESATRNCILWRHEAFIIIITSIDALILKDSIINGQRLVSGPLVPGSEVVAH